MKILIIGSDGKIGKPLGEYLALKGNIVFKTSRRDKDSETFFLDLLDVDSFLQTNPPDVDVIVFCAAITKFEDCRKNYQLAYEVNVNSLLRLAKYYTGLGTKIVFLSTNAVFNGQNPFESALTIPNALSEYGKLKAEAEKKLLNLNANVSILRFSKIIIPREGIFANWFSFLKEGKTIKAFTDQFISPIPLDLAVQAIHGVIVDSDNGVYQLSANKDISYFEMAKEIAALNKFPEELIVPISVYEQNIPHAEIFRYTSLDSSRIETLLNTKLPDPFTVLNNLF